VAVEIFLIIRCFGGFYFLTVYDMIEVMDELREKIGILENKIRQLADRL